MRAFFGSVWLLWKKFGQAIADFIARVLLTLFYFTLFAPFGLGVRLFGDPLAIKRKSGALWLERDDDTDVLESGRRLS